MSCTPPPRGGRLPVLAAPPPARPPLRGGGLNTTFLPAHETAPLQLWVGAGGVRGGVGAGAPTGTGTGPESSTPLMKGGRGWGPQRRRGRRGGQGHPTLIPSPPPSPGAGGGGGRRRGGFSRGNHCSGSFTAPDRSPPNGSGSRRSPTSWSIASWQKIETYREELRKLSLVGIAGTACELDASRRRPESGASVFQIQPHSRHRSADVIMGYVRERDKWRDNVLGKIGF